MIELYLYGNLRHAAGGASGERQAFELPDTETQTVGDLLRSLDIDPAEVGSLFLNGRLLHTRCSMALWLGYRQVEGCVPTTNSYDNVPIRPGDRLGIFPRNMSMLVV